MGTGTSVALLDAVRGTRRELPSSRLARRPRPNLLFRGPLERLRTGTAERHPCARSPHSGPGCRHINAWAWWPIPSALFHIARLEPGAGAGAETLRTLIPDVEEASAPETPAEPPLR